MQGTSNHSRLYQLTRAGTRLARYLDYVSDRPAVSAHLHFADIPAAPSIIESELQRLYAELERCQEEMFRPTCPTWRYDELLREVREIREEIAGYEDPDRPQPEDGDRDTEDAEDLTGDPNFEQGRKDADEYRDWDDEDDPDDHTPPLQLNGGDDMDDDDDYGDHSPEED